jgi:DNA topoisomerase IA
VYIYDKWYGKVIPDFEEGEEFTPTVCELKEGETSSPSYLTEADLVTLMDKNGIGTSLFAMRFLTFRSIVLTIAVRHRCYYRATHTNDC